MKSMKITNATADVQVVIEAMRARIVIETAFKIAGGGESGVEWLDPETLDARDQRISSRIGLTLTFRILETGSLFLEYSDGRTWTVEPDVRYEAWSFTTAQGSQTVCMPGGGLSSWGDPLAELELE